MKTISFAQKERNIIKIAIYLVLAKKASTPKLREHMLFSTVITEGAQSMYI